MTRRVALKPDDGPLRGLLAQEQARNALLFQHFQHACGPRRAVGNPSVAADAANEEPPVGPYRSRSACPHEGRRATAAYPRHGLRACPASSCVRHRSHQTKWPAGRATGRRPSRSCSANSTSPRRTRRPPVPQSVSTSQPETGEPVCDAPRPHPTARLRPARRSEVHARSWPSSLFHDRAVSSRPSPATVLPDRPRPDATACPTRREKNRELSVPGFRSGSFHDG